MASNLGNPPPVGGQATGLSASQLQDLVNDVRELYCCRATDSIFTKWYATDAAFTDPLGHLSPRIAFKGLAELFEPEPPNLRRFDVIEASNDVIKIALETGYYIKVPLAGRVGPLPFSCTTVLKLNKEGRVVQHEDNWARQLWHAEDGVIGKLADARRRLTGGMQWLFVKMTGGDRVEYGAAASGGAKQQQQQADVASTSTSGQPQQPPVHETT